MCAVQINIESSCQDEVTIDLFPVDEILDGEDIPRLEFGKGRCLLCAVLMRILEDIVVDIGLDVAACKKPKKSIHQSIRLLRLHTCERVLPLRPEAPEHASRASRITISGGLMLCSRTWWTVQAPA